MAFVFGGVCSIVFSTVPHQCNVIESDWTVFVISSIVQLDSGHRIIYNEEEVIVYTCIHEMLGEVRKVI